MKCTPTVISHYVYAELGLVHRHELSGALHGLFRVRAFTQDDAHVFMLPDQMQSELMKVIELFDRIYSQFGLKYHVELSTKPDNAMGDDANLGSRYRSIA